MICMQQKTSPPHPMSHLRKNATINRNTVNSPSLATILSYQITRSTRRALSPEVIRVRYIHNDFGVDVIVGNIGTTGGSLAFGGGTPTLSKTGVYNCCQQIRKAERRRKAYRSRVWRRPGH